jgi:hypothetical protein
VSRLQQLLSLVHQFKPRHDLGDDLWEFYIPSKRTWHYWWVKQYKQNHYCGGSHVDSRELNASSFDRQRSPETADWLEKYTAALRPILRNVKRDPVDYHRRLCRSLPAQLRTGVIHRSFVYTLIPAYARFDQELTPRELKRIIGLLKGPDPTTLIPALTSGRFFTYCRTAYMANPRTHRGTRNRHLNGLAMYKKWADGRDGGLTALPQDDAAAFAQWYHAGAGSGGHPWEIFRGGNSTHIDLTPRWDEHAKGWFIEIRAFSSTRLAEACRMALAFHAQGWPFRLAHRESYLRRLLAEDHLGVLPDFHDLKYGWQKFPEQFHVADCIHYSWFKDDHGRSVRPLHEIRQLISWFPIAPLQTM